MEQPNATRPVLIRGAIFTIVVCFCLFFVTAYGGIRTADGEVVFRVGDSLAQRGTFAVDRDLEAWPGFALPIGIDGRRYSVFGPAQSVILVPFIWIAKAANSTRWYEHFNVPVSFAADGDSFRQYMLHERPPDPEPHALRFLVSFFNIFVTSAVAVLQLLVVYRLTASVAAGVATALLTALATPLWHYSGTMFSEPLAIAFTLWSFYFLLDPLADSGLDVSSRRRRVFASGLLLGCGFTTHITALLAAPFFLLLAVRPCFGKGGALSVDRRAVLHVAASFLAGFGVMAALYGWYNLARFGSVFEEGRRVPQLVSYGAFVPPWEGLWGLVASPGKGLFLYCPLLFLSLFWWRDLHKADRFLSVVIASMALFRVAFIATRSDWHGGFCLGPRLVLLVLPFLLLPIGFRLASFFGRADARYFFKPPHLVVIFLFFACMAQQLYFCLGEPVSFYYMVKMAGLQHGVSVISNNRLYFHFSVSPLLHLFDGRRGPFLLLSVPFGQWELFAFCLLLLGVFFGVLLFCLIRIKDGLYKT